MFNQFLDRVHMFFHGRGFVDKLTSENARLRREADEKQSLLDDIATSNGAPDYPSCDDQPILSLVPAPSDSGHLSIDVKGFERSGKFDLIAFYDVEESEPEQPDCPAVDGGVTVHYGTFPDGSNCPLTGTEIDDLEERIAEILSEEAFDTGE